MAHPRAMVVEDEVALAGVLGSYLEREGFEVHVSYDGQAAVASAREVDPDIVVLDLGLPGLDGIEVCRQLRAFSDAYSVCGAMETLEFLRWRCADGRKFWGGGEHTFAGERVARRRAEVFRNALIATESATVARRTP